MSSQTTSNICFLFDTNLFISEA